MPELPEVETIANAMAQICVGQQIDKIRFYRDDLREPIPTKLMQETMTKSRVVSVTRRSKYILMETNTSCGIFHLGMTGNFLSLPSAQPKFKHTHVVFSFVDDNGRKSYLHYIDPRRFGRMTVCSREEMTTWSWFRCLGPEPLDPKLDLASHLFQHAKQRNTTVKQFIMDPKFVVGVGNIYATEALFRSKIRPDVRVNQLNRQKWLKLAKNIRSVLNEAISAGGTTLRDFKDTKGQPGYFHFSLQVYGRANKPCFVCHSKIHQLRLGGRSSFFCPSCQS